MNSTTLLLAMATICCVITIGSAVQAIAGQAKSGDDCKSPSQCVDSRGYTGSCVSNVTNCLRYDYDCYFLVHGS